MPSGGLTALVGEYARDSLVLSRYDASAGDFVDLAAQSFFVDPFPSGSLLRFGEGVTGQASSVPIYPATPEVDIEVGDEFVRDGVHYRVGYVGPAARVPAPSGSSTFTRVAFAVARSEFGEASA